MDTPAKRCFEGVHFGLDLGYGFTLNQKAKFRDLLQAQGGIIDLVFSEQSDCLVVTEEKVHSNLYKVEKARKLFKPVVTPSYLVDAVEKGRIVDAEVMELDGLVNPPNPAKARVVADAELEVVPAINEAVMAIQCVFASADAVPEELLDRLRRPVWMAHFTALFYKCVPDPRLEEELEQPDALSTVDSGFSIENLRVEKEMQIREAMQLRVEQKAEEERLHVIKMEERREREAAMQEEIERFEASKAAHKAHLEQQRLREEAKALREAETAKRLAEQKEAREKKVADRARKFQTGIGALPRAVTSAVTSTPKKKAPAVPSEDGWTLLEKGAKPKAPEKPMPAPQKPKLQAWKPVIEKKPTDAGLKVFLGGFAFDDITKKATNEKWSDAKAAEVKAGRIEEIKRMAAAFGAVTAWEEKWDEGFAFVTYEKKEDAARALKTLSQFDHRKGLSKMARARLVAANKEKLMAPPYSFYVRWPKFYQRIIETNKSKKEEEKRKEQEAKALAKVSIAPSF